MAPETEKPPTPPEPQKKETLFQEFIRRFQGYWVEVYQHFDLKNPDNCWFWGLFLYTHLYVFCLWVELLSRPIAWFLGLFSDIEFAQDMFSPNPKMYQMYIILLGGFVLFNKTLRLIVRDQEVIRPGNYMFVMWMVTGGIMFMLNSITKGYLLVPRDLYDLMWQNMSIFGLGEIADKGLEKIIARRVAQAITPPPAKPPPPIIEPRHSDK